MKSIHSKKPPERVLDLLDANSLKALGLAENQLTGPIGAHTLNGLKLSALGMGHSFLAFRDPIRPGRVVVESLKTGKQEQWRPFDSAKLLEKICDGMTAAWDLRDDDPINWDMIYPPVTTPPLQYARALEWLVTRYPDAVVAWVELALTYDNELKIPYALEPLYEECKNKCKHWRVVGHVLGLFSEDEKSNLQCQRESML